MPEQSAPLRRAEKCFFLTSPLIEPFDEPKPKGMRHPADHWQGHLGACHPPALSIRLSTSNGEFREPIDNAFIFVVYFDKATIFQPFQGAGYC
jgi:hypothetical protein